MAWKKPESSEYQIKRISDKYHNNNQTKQNDIIDIPNNNHDDGHGAPQPHIDGEVQEGYVYDYYIDHAI